MRRKRPLLQRVFNRNNRAVAFALRLLSFVASKLGLVRLIQTKPVRWVVRAIVLVFALLLRALKRVRRFVDKILHAHWFYHTWTTLLTIAACGLLGWRIILSPLVAASVVLVLLYVIFVMVRPFEAFLVWIVAAPLFQAHNIELGRRIPNMTFDRVALTLILVTVVVRKLLSRKMAGRLDVADIAIGTFVIISTANVLLARITGGSLAIFSREMKIQETVTTIQTYADHYLYAFATFYIVRNVVDNQRRIGLVLIAIAAIAVYLVPIGVYEHFSGKSWFTETRELHWADANRAAGPFKNPSVYGTVLGVCFVIALHRFFQTRLAIRRIIYALGLLAIVAGLVMTFTRAAWLGPAVALLALVAFYPGKRKVITAWIVAGVFIILLALPAIKASPLYERRILYRRPIESRVLIARNSIEMFKDKPVFGVGINNFDFYKRFYPVYIPGTEGYVGPTSHNTFLTILVETGLVGFIPYVAVLAILAWRWLITYIRAPANPQVGSRQLVAAIGTATICYFVTASLVDMRFFRYVEYLFWLLLGLVAVQYAMLQTRREQHAAPVSEVAVKAA